ncbi:hypothetical protein Z968_08220 [Clostridium novyi A str. 4552]|uniref:Peptidase S8/S53 domain-containing protein n=1 Tax=Clostridium novyi A str. 4552 TaxID=1444289 RepID=A0A0A0I693_CLONO|nr:S8 family peptidase [Clostridium novyi]KGM95821.1 hypothetical protein Z968_08220 [Clostridium novyi A str. 4552]
MDFMPILANGEKLAREISKGKSGGPKKLPYTYEEAKKRIINDINDISNEIQEHKELYLENEIIINIRMAENFIAKSYIPSIFNKKESMEFVGARIYNRKVVENKEIKSKLYFVKCSKDNLDWFMNDLNIDNFNKTQIKQLRSIEKIDVLSAEEKALGFDEKKDEYEVEIVLHPLRYDKKIALTRLSDYLEEGSIVKEYENGPVFILAKIKQENLLNISKYNFLRTVHPMREIKLPKLRTVEGSDLPQIPQAKEISNKIKIGVFDGGVNEKNLYLKPYLKNHDLSSLPPKIDTLQHGNAVCGAVLYGEMNKYKNKEQLPPPKCIVESFRVLPEKNLYAVIENIENVVNSRSDIDIYNISFGPRGPILDDQINRFTYSLDKLALKNKIFCIAVGNDGNVMKPFNRIQSPSDAVNCIGVGAYSKFDGKIYRAEYSCIGEGREGAKLKPDLLAFGGDERNLFQAISLDGTSRLMTAGTSFSSPIVAGKVGEITQVSEELDPIMARTLLIHSAHKELGNAEEEGFGILEDNVENIIKCSENKVTILYKGFIIPSRCIKLPIPLPDISNQSGNINFSWTICTLTDVSILDSDLYTNTCIEETFYPNSNVFSFTKRGEKAVKVDVINQPELVKELELLGYKKSKNPVGDTVKRRNELQRRLDYKWDTISRKAKGKKIDGVNDPFLIISALSRDEGDLMKVRFSVAITVEMKKYKGNMYADILNKYDVLAPIQIEQEIEQEIQEITK